MAKKPQWSRTRPTKPERDPLLDQITAMLEADKRSRFAKANVSGLSMSTLKSWSEGRVRRPQGVSLQMAAKALGYKLAIVKE